MRINILRLREQEVLKIEETIDFSSHEQIYPINKMSKVDVVLYAKKVLGYIYVDFKFKANVNVQCSYSLEYFNYTTNVNDSIIFCIDKDVHDEESVLVLGHYINLDEYIYNLIVSSLPLKLVKKGANISYKDDFVKIVKDKQFKNEPKQASSPFDKLDDIDI